MDAMLPTPASPEFAPSSQPETARPVDARPSTEPTQEVIASGPERLSSANQAVAQAVVAVPASPVVPVLTQTPQPHTSTISAPTDDTPVIEKEWVAMAKEIIARTRQDPRQQSTELNTVKTNYVRKRFGKEIRLTDDSQTQNT